MQVGAAAVPRDSDQMEGRHQQQCHGFRLHIFQGDVVVVRSGDLSGTQRAVMRTLS